MRRLLGFTALLLLAGLSPVAAQEYPVTGLVLEVDRSRNTFTASIQAVPGFITARWTHRRGQGGTISHW